ncbi:MAG TPA: hypothetical protein DIT64_01380 [Verrucomicrobiales bacterium]|nr:hypothetical protein [Verrucomicrobiales bacterium]
MTPANEQQRVSILFTGILVCVPVLALHRFGLFPEMAVWLEERLPRLLVLPEHGLRMSLPLQYACFTALAFLSARAGLARGGLWLKMIYLLAVTHLTVCLAFTLAWAGILFEPFSGVLAAWAACLVAVIVADLEQRRPETPEPEIAKEAPAARKTTLAQIVEAGVPGAPETDAKPDAPTVTGSPDNPAKNNGPVIVAKA